MKVSAKANHLWLEGLVVLGQNELVVLALHWRHVNAHDELGLGGHVLEHVGLEAAQKMGAEQVVEFLHLVVLGEVAELAQELGQVVEVLGPQEVEEVEELFQVVLQRRACATKVKSERQYDRMGRRCKVTVSFYWQFQLSIWNKQSVIFKMRLNSFNFNVALCTYVTLRDTRDMRVWTKISYWIFYETRTKYIC